MDQDDSKSRVAVSLWTNTMAPGLAQRRLLGLIGYRRCILRSQKDDWRDPTSKMRWGQSACMSLLVQYIPAGVPRRKGPAITDQLELECARPRVCFVIVADGSVVAPVVGLKAHHVLAKIIDVHHFGHSGSVDSWRLKGLEGGKVSLDSGL